MSSASESDTDWEEAKARFGRNASRLRTLNYDLKVQPAGVDLSKVKALMAEAVRLHQEAAEAYKGGEIDNLPAAAEAATERAHRAFEDIEYSRPDDSVSIVPAPEPVKPSSKPASAPTAEPEPVGEEVSIRGATKPHGDTDDESTDDAEESGPKWYWVAITVVMLALLFVAAFLTLHFLVEFSLVWSLATMGGVLALFIGMFVLLGRKSKK